MAEPNRQGAIETLRYGARAIARGAEVIRAGGLVAVPTETVYGLAADATDARAVARIYAAKGRPSFNPLIVHVRSLDEARSLAVFGEAALALAEAFWPGPLTLVLPRRSDAPIASLVTAGLDTIALRMPAHPAMRDLIMAADRPLAAPSANPSGGISPTRAEHVASRFREGLGLIIDAGATDAGLESTIVAPGPPLRLLRPGPVTAEQVQAVLGAVPGEAGARIEAPGQLASHYAPDKPLRLDATGAREGEYLIGFGDVAGDAQLSAGGDLVEAAARLFDCLHRADAAGSRAIAVAPVPAVGIGVAINDRLRRAATR
ncbi:L-threonylcarbamoyladenylate synthase [Stakelama saccharophila]|uniref:Threonylcarbamoyl-AMP synthase n=1 Tax=Stakelama saccharophila TaxID=3075605 RepID=A0ABZ0BBB6_9SPHN|nr:L-threonylcarbamoyladenylate synthase [Stakelama sp. W311]WNO54574.1 L-threonylcarbamoyladenylate synthase [Stakelama sp. W311]